MNDETQSLEQISDEQKAILDARSAEFEKDQNLGTEWYLLKKLLLEDE